MTVHLVKRFDLVGSLLVVIKQEQLQTILCQMVMWNVLQSRGKRPNKIQHFVL